MKGKTIFTNFTLFDPIWTDIGKNESTVAYSYVPQLFQVWNQYLILSERYRGNRPTDNAFLRPRDFRVTN